MKIQGKEVVFDFDTAADYDLLAYGKGLRDTLSIAMGITAEFKRLEKKFDKPTDKLTDDERSEFHLPLNLAEIRLLAQATTHCDENEMRKIMTKELETRSVLEIGMDFVNEFMQSKIFVAAKIQAEDENPKQPK